MAHEEPPPRAGRRAAVLGTRRLAGAGALGDYFSGASEALAAYFRAEADAARLAPWLPVAFGIGILLYFAAPAEPSLIAAMAALGFLVIAAWLSREHATAFVIALGLTFLAAGFAVSTLRSVLVAHPVLTRNPGPVTLQGFVESRTPPSARTASCCGSPAPSCAAN